ncbi:MAG TPA: hypothetical protein DHW82_14145 [Spirochaetia bacterium]|nr:MAG: hypothetical protein A2Y41_00075 [Spirochaetes bacterium GWB1_36_13]HCL58131.1 hypothetical protein [Spirochaetia bacterium]
METVFETPSLRKKLNYYHENMESENKKIHSHIEIKPISLFLSQSSELLQNEPKLYSLKDELSQAKKNKTLFVFIMLALFLILSLVSTFLVTFYLESQSRRLKFDLNAFEDLNLSELINSAKKNEEELSKVKMALENSQKNKEDEILKIKSQFSKQKTVILTQNLSEEEKIRLLNEMQEKEKQAIGNAETRYQKEILDKQKQINQINSQISAYERKLSETTKENQKKLQETIQKNQEEMNNAEKLKELQLQKQKEFYEKELEKSRKEYQAFLTRSNEEKQLLATSLKAKTEEASSLDAVKKELENTNQTLTDDYVALSSNYQKTKNALVKFYQSLDKMAQKRKEQGYIAELLDNDRVLVILNSYYTVKNKDTAMIFNQDNEYIAEIRFLTEEKTPYQTGVVAEIRELKKNAAISLFDKIIIKLK